MPNDSTGEQKSIVFAQTKLFTTLGSKHVAVRCGLQDKAGNLWFGTTGEGVYRYDGKFFEQFTVKDGLSHNSVWSILEDKAGNIWFGTTNGICRYDGKKIIKVPIPQYLVPAKSNNNYYNDWSTKNNVWSMLQDKSGKLWFGSGDGMYCYDGTSFTRFLQHSRIENKDSLHMKMVFSMLEDDSGYIWFASGMLPGSEGLIRYDGKSVINFKLTGQEWIFNLVDDKKGILWLATRHNGIVKYNGKTFTKILIGGEVGLACLIDKKGNLWFSTNGDDMKGSLWRYDGESYTNYSVKDGLNNNDVNLILEDNSGNIWVGTIDLGLYKYDGKTFTSFSP